MEALGMQGMRYWAHELNSHNTWSLKSSQSYNWKENLSLFIEATKAQSTQLCLTISKEVNRNLAQQPIFRMEVPKLWSVHRFLNCVSMPGKKC